MTIQEALTQYHQIEIDLLLAHVLGKPKEFLFINPDFRLLSAQVKKINRLVSRRLKGEPIAYLLGYKDFYGLRFKVNRYVLIPRPETELIVEAVIASVAKQSETPKRLLRRSAPRNDTIKILDVGTGSGCIAVAIARQLQNFQMPKSKIQIFASDISKKALSIAKQNAKTHCVKIKFIRGDLLTNIKDKFDIIIANLPYVPIKDFRLRIKDLKYEPFKAIFAKEKGLFLINKLLSQIAQKETKPRMIFLEFDPRQKSALEKVIKKRLPQGEVKFYRDFSKKWRCAEITLKPNV